jgi:hypothetical protein
MTYPVALLPGLRRHPKDPTRAFQPESGSRGYLATFVVQVLVGK